MPHWSVSIYFAKTNKGGKLPSGVQARVKACLETARKKFEDSRGKNGAAEDADDPDGEDGASSDSSWRDDDPMNCRYYQSDCD